MHHFECFTQLHNAEKRSINEKNMTHLICKSTFSVYNTWRGDVTMTDLLFGLLFVSTVNIVGLTVVRF